MKITNNYQLLNEKILNHYISSGKDIILISIGGLSCSGKSTLSKNINDYFSVKNILCRTIHLDNWIIDLDKRTEFGTVRERFDYNGIVDQVTKYIQGQKIVTFSYNSQLRKKTKKKYVVEPIRKGIILVEGVICLDIPKLRNLSDLLVFIRTSEYERFKRFIEFNRYVKKINLERCKELYEQRQKDELPFINSTEIYSDIIYEN